MSKESIFNPEIPSYFVCEIDQFEATGFIINGHKIQLMMPDGRCEDIIPGEGFILRQNRRGRKEFEVKFSDGKVYTIEIAYINHGRVTFVSRLKEYYFI
jgi:hypothetical protein